LASTINHTLLENTNIPAHWHSSIDDSAKFIYFHPPTAGNPAVR